MIEEPTPIWIVPEFCPGPIFLGWHLYERQVQRDRPNLPGRRWDWLQHAMQVVPVEKVIRDTGVACPAVTYDVGAGNSHDFIEWFVLAYPAGVVVDRAPYHSYQSPRLPPIDCAVPLIYDNARAFVRAAKRHGRPWVEGAPGHPVATWTDHDYRWCAEQLLDAGRLWLLAREMRRVAPHP